MNLPNKLSLIRIILVPIMVATFYMAFIPFNYLITAVIFTVAAFTDFLDGHIARKYNLVTDLGKFLDPIADKILVIGAFIIMLTTPCIFAGSFGFTFYQLAGGIGVTIIVARELIVSVLRMLAAGKGKVLAAEKSGKIKTFVTDVAIVLLLLSAEFSILFIAGIILYIISVALTVYSGTSYVVKNREVFK
jgi:CDP-diacylglycerol--glycerol-3-phosphate 3-phosphatidyltransferase